MTDTPENIPPTAAEIRNMVDRIVRLEEEKKETADTIKDIYTEADSRGYDAPALRRLVKEARETDKQREKRETTETALELMRAALGTFVATPLGDAAMRGMR